MNQPNPDLGVPPLATAEHFLSCVEVMVDWAALQPAIDSTGDRPANAPSLAALKIALLKQWYGIAETETAFAVLDRLSFRSFIGYQDNSRPEDAAILEELRQGAWSRHPSMEELLRGVEDQLRELGYVVRGGQLREPFIAPCAQSTEERPQAGSTALYRPGELGRMVEAVTAKARSETRPSTGPQERALPAEQGLESADFDGLEIADRDGPDIAGRDGPGIAGRDKPDVADLNGLDIVGPDGVDIPDPDGLNIDIADPDGPNTVVSAGVRAVLEWPWGQKTELSVHLNIGRDYSFSPLARELTPYTHVSRRHAELLVYGDGVWLRDLGSRNGTFVNNDEVPKGQAYLIDADAIVRFGPLLAVSVKISD